MSDKGVKSGSKQGFSMVELLVIMAIIAIVMMLLLPALQRAKNKGRYSLHEQFSAVRQGWTYVLG